MNDEAAEFSEVPASGSYRPGLGTEEEAVVSAHFLSRQIESLGTDLYDDRVFRARSLTLTITDFQSRLVSLMRARSEIAIERRVEAAMRTAVACENPAYRVVRAELRPVVAALTDRWYRKGPLTNVDLVSLASTFVEALASSDGLRLGCVSISRVSAR